MSKLILLLIIFCLVWVLYQTYKTNELPQFVVKTFEKVAAFKNWVVNKFKKEA